MAGDIISTQRDKVVEALMRPLDPATIKKVKIGGGKEADYLPIERVYLNLYEACGPIGWTSEIVSTEVVSTEKKPVLDAQNKARVNEATGEVMTTVTVSARVIVKLTIGDPANPYAVHMATGHGTSANRGTLAEAIPHATEQAEASALKRAAVKLGPRLGLGLKFKDETERLSLRLVEDADADDAPTAPTNHADQGVQTRPAAPPPSTIPPGAATLSPPWLALSSWTALVEWLNGHRYFGAQPNEVCSLDLKKGLSDFAKKQLGDEDWKRVTKGWEECGVVGKALPTFSQATDFVLYVNLLAPQRGAKATTERTSPAQATSDLLGVNFADAKPQQCTPAGDRPCGDLAPLPDNVQAYVQGFKNPNDLLDVQKINVELGLKGFLRSVFADDADKVKQTWASAGHVPAPGSPLFRWSVEKLAENLRSQLASVSA